MATSSGTSLRIFSSTFTFSRSTAGTRNCFARARVSSSSATNPSLTRAKPDTGLGMLGLPQRLLELLLGDQPLSYEEVAEAILDDVGCHRYASSNRERCWWGLRRIAPDRGTVGVSDSRPTAGILSRGRGTGYDRFRYTLQLSTTFQVYRSGPGKLKEHDRGYL